MTGREFVFEKKRKKKGGGGGGLILIKTKFDIRKLSRHQVHMHPTDLYVYFFVVYFCE